MTWQDVLLILSLITAVAAAGYAIARVARSFWAGFEIAVKAATSELHEDVRDTKHVVQHHLGPNGTTTPVWERLETVETTLNKHMDDVADDRAKTDEDRERHQGDR